MTLFVVICALLAAVAVALLAWPLLRPPGGHAEPRERSAISATVVSAVLPLVAFSTYFLMSNWSWEPAAQHGTDASAPDLRQMVAQLRERLTRAPDDLEGWKLLGRSATVLGDYGLAREAFGNAMSRSDGQDPDAIVGYAESLVLNDEREIDGEAAELFEKALGLAPDNARALWYGGIVAYRRGDLPLAQQRWVELQNHDLPPDLRQVVAERLADIGRSQGVPPAAVATAQAATGATGIPLTIDLAPALAAQTPPAATLFVIARRGEGGPPLAVKRRAVGAWPVSLQLTDADAMLPGTNLAEGGPVRVIARISRGGQPVAASGDLFGEIDYDFGSARPARITIDRIVP